MGRVRKHIELGFRWIRCGWRLLRRNPWLLAGMGSCASALIGALAFVPFIGGPLVALLAPALLAGVYLALDATARQKLPLPAELRVAALKQAPRALAIVVRDDGRLLQALMLGLLCAVVAVLAHLAMWLIAGGAWTHGGGWQLAALPRLLAAAAFGTTVYASLAALLVYALPLAFLKREPLVPAMSRSWKAALRYWPAHLTLAVFALAPVVLGSAALRWSAGLACLAGVLAGTIVLPAAVAAWYCSYRSVVVAAETPAAGFLSRPARTRAA